MRLLPFLSRRFFSSPPQKFTVPRLLASKAELKNVLLEGWIQRSQKRGLVNFFWINDGLSPKTVQVVIPKDIQSSISVGSAVKVLGSWLPSSGRKQEMEMLATSVEIAATDADPRYADLSPDILRRKLHLRSKSGSFASLLRLRSHFTQFTHNFFMDNEFINIDIPTFTANDCEGAGETFSIANNSFFGDKSGYLTVSGQLHLEAISSGISQVYTLSSAYRADKQQSSSHLTEFKMLEAEIAFCEELEVLLNMIESYLKACVNEMLTNQIVIDEYNNLSNFSYKEHLLVLREISRNSNFPRITYSEAISILKEKGEIVQPDGLNKKNERFLFDYFNSPVFITHFPSSQKPFYMKRTKCGHFTDSFDFLCPIVGELAGGSIRESSCDILNSRGNSIDWYEECRKRGKPISGGFGIGFDRLLQVLFGIRNIKDTIPFPRWFKHCQC